MFVSRLMDSAELNYTITEKECLGLVWSLDKFKTFIWGCKVKVVTDHHALCWLMKKRKLAGRLARWSLALQGIDIEIVHRSGRLHADADALSRDPVSPPEQEGEIPMLFLSTAQNLSNVGVSQLESGWCRIIIDNLRSKTHSKKSRKQYHRFLIKNGLLYHRSIKGGVALDRLCIPQNFVNDVLVSCHDDITAGHLGTERTLHKIRTRFFFGQKWIEKLSTTSAPVSTVRQGKSL